MEKMKKNLFGCCAEAEPCPANVPCSKEEKTETTMRDYNVATAVGVTASIEDMAIRQQKYFLNRLDKSMEEKKDALKIQFGIRTKDPMDLGEALEWIKAGKYELTDEAAESYYGSFGYNITWKPDFPTDKKGYEAAKTKLVALVTSTRDQIMAGDAAAQLAALTAFESATIQ